MKQKNLFTSLTLSCIGIALSFPALANRFDEIMNKMLREDVKGVVGAELGFSGTTIWVLLATFFICIGMIGLASQVSKELGGVELGGGGGEKSMMATAAIGGAAVSLTAKGGKALYKWNKNRKKNGNNETSSALQSGRGANIGQFEGTSNGSASGGMEGQNGTGGGGGQGPTSGFNPQGEQSQNNASDSNSSNSDKDKHMDIPPLTAPAGSGTGNPGDTGTTPGGTAAEASVGGLIGGALDAGIAGAKKGLGKATGLPKLGKDGKPIGTATSGAGVATRKFGAEDAEGVLKDKAGNVADEAIKNKADDASGKIAEEAKNKMPEVARPEVTPLTPQKMPENSVHVSTVEPPKGMEPPKPIRPLK